MRMYGNVRSYTGKRRERGRKEALADAMGFYADQFGGIYSIDDELVSQWENDHGYLIFQAGSLPVLVHRFVWHYFNGPIPKHMVIEHVDRDRSNAWLYNLRCVTRSVSQKNKCPRTFIGQCRFALARFRDGLTAQQILKEAHLLSESYLTKDFKWRDEEWLKAKGII